MQVGDLVTLRWGEGKRGAGMIVGIWHTGNAWIDEVQVEWFSEWTSPTWVRTADLEIVNESR